MALNSLSSQLKRHLYVRELVLIIASLLCILRVGVAVAASSSGSQAPPPPPPQPSAQHILDKLREFRDAIQPECAYFPIRVKSKTDVTATPTYPEYDLLALLLRFFYKCSSKRLAPITRNYPARTAAVLNVLRKCHLIHVDQDPLMNPELERIRDKYGGPVQGDIQVFSFLWARGIHLSHYEHRRVMVGLDDENLQTDFYPDCKRLNRFRDSFDKWAWQIGKSTSLGVSTNPDILGQAYEILGKYSLANFNLRMSGFSPGHPDARFARFSKYEHFLGAILLTEDVSGRRFHDLTQEDDSLKFYAEYVEADSGFKNVSAALAVAHRLADKADQMEPLILPMCLFYFHSFTRGFDQLYHGLITDLQDSSSTNDEEFRITYPRLIRAIQADYLDFKTNLRPSSSSASAKIRYSHLFPHVKRQFLFYIAREFYHGVVLPPEHRTALKSMTKPWQTISRKKNWWDRAEQNPVGFSLVTLLSGGIGYLNLGFWRGWWPFNWDRTTLSTTEGAIAIDGPQPAPRRPRHDLVWLIICLVALGVMIIMAAILEIRRRLRQRRLLQRQAM